MNLLIQRNEARISIKVPAQMKLDVNENASKMNMSDSQYIKLAISERLEKDLQPQ
ncbi:MAG: hypothetical protein JZU47_22625 [Prolixibacteraceae bacterium]|nr:hypothetical protein [Prolixibacteraceae bacterium]MBV5316112.1 hypothetical protein [Prolixibacteraceae bacterium]